MIRSDLFEWAQGLDGGADVLVIGGGATGLGVAVQAAADGRRVALVVARDLAFGPSSPPTKLLHGCVGSLGQRRCPAVRDTRCVRPIVPAVRPHPRHHRRPALAS